jgi:hypothetical protein
MCHSLILQLHSAFATFRNRYLVDSDSFQLNALTKRLLQKRNELKRGIIPCFIWFLKARKYDVAARLIRKKLEIHHLLLIPADISCLCNRKMDVRFNLFQNIRCPYGRYNRKNSYSTSIPLNQTVHMKQNSARWSFILSVFTCKPSLWRCNATQSHARASRRNTAFYIAVSR